MMEGATPLLAASLQGHAEVVSYLCEAGADKDQAICDGVTAFHAAAERGHADVVRRLCEAGADKNKAMRNGLTPLLAACLQGHEEVVGILCNAGVKMDGPMKEDILLSALAVKKGRPMHQLYLCGPALAGQGRLLLDAGGGEQSAQPGGSAPSAPAMELDLLSSNPEEGCGLRLGATSLHVAASHGHLGVVQELCRARASMEMATRAGSTPLLAAAQAGHLEVVRALCESKACLDGCPSSRVESPLIAAVTRGHVEVVRVLTEARADPSKTLSSGATPLLAASLLGLEDVAAILRQEPSPAAPDPDRSQQQREDEAAAEELLRQVFQNRRSSCAVQ